MPKYILVLLLAVSAYGAAIDDAARAFLTSAAAGVVPSKVGSSPSNSFGGGLMFFSTSLFTNLNATATLSNLANVMIPANTLTNAGDTIWAAWGVKLANGVVNTNQFQVRYGSATLLDTGLQVSSNTAVSVRVVIMRTGNTSQHVEAWLSWGPGGGVPFTSTNVNMEISETNGIPNLLALRGAARRLGAHTNNGFRVSWDGLR